MMSSGLFVASKYPVLDAEFFPFTQVFMPLKKITSCKSFFAYAFFRDQNLA